MGATTSTTAVFGALSDFEVSSRSAHCVFFLHLKVVFFSGRALQQKTVHPQKIFCNTKCTFLDELVICSELLLPGRCGRGA